MVKTKFFFPFAGFALSLYFTVYVLGSDGCLGASLAGLPFLALLILKNLKGKPKKLFLYALEGAVLLCATALLLLSIVGKMPLLLDFIVKSVNGTSGRDHLYFDALRVFNFYPLFGVGFGYYNHYTLPPYGDVARLFNFHSTFFHVLASLGMVGILAYGFYFYQRFKILTKRNTCFNDFAFMSIGFFTCYGIADCVEFHTMPCVITVTLFILCTEFANRKKTEQEFCPLFYQPKKYSNAYLTCLRTNAR
jgi:hypothetical protein